MSHKLDFSSALPMISVQLSFQEKHIFIDRVLVDTGSMGTIFSSDRWFEAGMPLGQGSSIVKMIGIGGTEMVAQTVVDALSVGNMQKLHFTVQVGMMDYGFELNGILGMDFLRSVGARIDLEQGTIDSNTKRMALP